MTVRLPERGDHVIVRHGRAVVERACEPLGELDAPHAAGLRACLHHDLRSWHPDRQIGIWHRDDLGDDPARRAIAAGVLSRAERGVLTRLAG
jgi:hypothetical protein